MTACKSEDEPVSLGSAASTAPRVETLRSEPAMSAGADAASQKLFTNALRAFRRRDFSYAAEMFTEAERRHRLRAGSGDEFIYGCIYYTGRCREAALGFDEAKEYYGKIPEPSAYQLPAAARLRALTEDSDGDGYSDAWEESEGANPLNPLSHP